MTNRLGGIAVKSERTWILIADGAHAKVYQHSEEKPKLEAVKDLSLEINLPRTHEIVSDRAGRSFESQGRTRHAKSGRSDPHRELKRNLARKVADALKSSLTDKRYDKLVLVAPPVTLGDLRDALAKRVQARVVAELAQDLIKVPASRLPTHLVDVLPFYVPRARAPSGMRGKGK
jgi:protein required for attachment to host cells